MDFTKPADYEQKKQLAVMMKKMSEDSEEFCIKDTDRLFKCVAKEGSYAACSNELKKRLDCVATKVEHTISQMVKDKDQIDQWKKMMPSLSTSIENFDKDLQTDLKKLPKACIYYKRRVELCQRVMWFTHKRMGQDCRNDYRNLIECAAKEKSIPLDKEFGSCWKKNLGFSGEMTHQEWAGGIKKCLPLAQKVIDEFNK